MSKANFSEMFNRIYEKHGNELEKLRKSVLTKQILFIIITIGIEYFAIRSLIKPINSEYDFAITLSGLFAIIPIIFCFFSVRMLSRKYVRTFKEKAIRVLVENQNDTYKYKFHKGVTAIEYSLSGFDRSFSDFHSEDYISGVLDGAVKFEMSQIETVYKKESIDNEGNRTSTTVTTFKGLYGFMKLPIVSDAEVEILENNGIRKFKNSRVEMDSSEFEKYYDVLAEDRVWAMQVLTSSAIEELIDIREYFKKPIRIKIVRNIVYFAIDCGDLFEPPKLMNVMNFDKLYRYFRIIDIPRWIYENIAINIATGAESRALMKMKEFNEIDMSYKENKNKVD